jgi:hypothetical protein
MKVFGQIRKLSRRQLVVGLLTTAFIGALIYDFVFLERGETFVRVEPADLQVPFRATLKLTHVHFDNSKHRVMATPEWEIVAQDKNVALYNIAVSVDGRIVHNVIDQAPTDSDCVSSDTAYPGDLKGVVLTCPEIALGATEGAVGIVLYPFDHYQGTIRTIGKVATEAGRAAEEFRPNVQVDRLEIAAPEGSLALAEVPRQDQSSSLIFAYKRKFFIRLITITVLGMSCVFLWHLIRISEIKELYAQTLGMFGTLWALRALVVTADVDAFPTLVDYFVLSLFVLLFGIVLVKLPAADRRRK